jgi:hypothetical protein
LALWWYLLALAPVAAIAYAVWSYRKKSVEREAASRERLALLVGSAAALNAPGENAPRGGSAAAPSPPLPGWVARERFLSQPETLLYYLLRAGLPDHQVFAHVNLAALVAAREGLPGFEREQQLRRLAQHRLGFVICDKAMRVVAAIDLEPAAGRELKAECLGAAGIRLVVLDPGAPPRREDVRQLVLGARD